MKLDFFVWTKKDVGFGENYDMVDGYGVGHLGVFVEVGFVLFF